MKFLQLHHRNGELVSLSTNARKFKVRYLFLFLLIASLVAWYCATPGVIVHYPKEATDELRLIWDTHDQITRQRMLPGEATSELGHIFPDENFFMVFFWWTDRGFRKCIDITPKRWATIDIYLDRTGRVDIERTTPDVIARLKKCDGEPDPFRP
ncbi:hypothetical protein PUP66_18745 [Pseudomonas chlororaphis]|uniref:hypothetical protein n=1 Tax=Pseudomonas chlororaphis TaxID=587753 RepID=UPI000E0B82A1|nr:hypothetical protein [Pseudomonas chlororaphis]WDH45146.1 hypothetical protein PUP66_18745 [Pseudomonas chlororaphis]WDH56992.1 hypothetical protein PUP56_18750 [Pseudomonas chlororaphis]WQE16251.1 hypothetical protein U0007_17560 [Pseudomonas chlororaphis]